MTDFSKKFAIQLLTEAVLKENSWFTDLLLRWHPAGDAVNSRPGDGKGVFARDWVKKCELQNLRVAFRGGYMNFYCGGQSIANVNFGRDGLQAKIHVKYVYGSKGIGQKYVTLNSKGSPELGSGQPVAYDSMLEWILNANRKIGREKRFVDFVVAHNSEVIDLEMALPAYSIIPGKRPCAPRVDLVALEPCEGRWQVAFWEVKLVGDGRVRCEGSELPEVVDQLKHYTDWFCDRKREESVGNAYQENCQLLVGLHAIARRIRPDIEELGDGIRAVAESGAPPLLVDIKPRLLIIYNKKGESFRKNGHYDKLMGAGLHVKTVEDLSEVALCGQS
jgi:hypothetical protein